MTKVEYHHNILLKMDFKMYSESFSGFYVARLLSNLVSKYKKNAVWNDLEG